MNIFFIIFLILILISITSKRESIESFSNFYLGNPTKCFSCERELPYPYKYLGGRTKCFSCEKELVRRFGPQYGSLGQPTKCFSCLPKQTEKIKSLL